MLSCVNTCNSSHTHTHTHTHTIHMQSVASEWVDTYQQDPEQAMMELIQYFVFSCGCKAFITMDMFRAETSDVIRTLTENFAEVRSFFNIISYIRELLLAKA